MNNEKKNVPPDMPLDLLNALADETETERGELVAVWSLLEKVGATFEPSRTAESDSASATGSSSTASSSADSYSTDSSWSAVASRLSISSSRSEGRAMGSDTQVSSVKAARPAQDVPTTGMRAIKLQPNARPTAASDDRRPALTLLRLNTRSWVGIAASFALLVLAFQWFVPVTMQALPGEQASFVLPDGSAVEVNSETHLAYARPLRAAFDATRTVELRGEAFFSVRKSDKPFVVAVENASVRVVGTQFNVQSRLVGGVPRTSVAVVEGHVILNNTSGASMDLTAGAFAVVDAQEAPVLESASPARIAGWKEGTLALIDLPLGDLLDELERRFDRTVEVAGGVNLTNRKTAYYSAERSLESILADLCFSEKLAYKPIANGFRIELP